MNIFLRKLSGRCEKCGEKYIDSYHEKFKMCKRCEKCEKCDKEYSSFYHEKNIWCQPCQINHLKENFTNWTSGNDKIDDFIQEMQLKINDPDNIVFEWIPHNQFRDIKKIGSDGFYSAIWNNGPLNYKKYKKWTRESGQKVNLKYLYNTNKFPNKVEYSINDCVDTFKVYGISQNSNTKDYIMVLQPAICESCGNEYSNATYKWCKPCQINNLKNNFMSKTSGNEKIDAFIQEMQLKINEPDNIVFEWIPYDQFSDIKEIGGFYTVYSAAIWKDGPLHYNKKWSRNSKVKVYLKYLYTTTNKFLKEVEEYSNDNKILIYGVSQSPYTKDYIIVLHAHCKECGYEYTNVKHVSYRCCKQCQIEFLKANFKSWTSGNKKIDDFIQKMQLKINDPDDIIFEWIPYNQLSNNKLIGKDGFGTTIWKDGPLHYNKKWTRESEIKVLLYSSQCNTNEFLNEAEKYSSNYNDNEILMYGVSKNPYTKDYIMILQYTHCKECGCRYTNIKNASYKWCKPCLRNYLIKNFTNWTSGNKNIDYFIQGMQLKINGPDDIVFEWIQYNQFSDIKIIDGIDIVSSAIWKDGPTHYKKYNKKWIRDSIKVYLNWFCNITTNEFLNKAKEYSTDNEILIYGVSQNPDTNDYIMVLQPGHCKKCGHKYADINNALYRWCKKCQVNYFKKKFTNWTSGNKKIDDYIQKMQLKINDPDNVVFEWIPYNQFSDIKIIGKDGFDKVYSAIWKDGPLHYNKYNKKWVRDLNKKVKFKYLYNLQDIKDKYSIIKSSVYGVSQNPDTKDYIIVLVFEYYYCEKCVMKNKQDMDNLIAELEKLQSNQIQKYVNLHWCIICQTNDRPFANWSSGIQKIDDLIQEMLLIKNNIVFEWIPYNQFSNIKKIGKGGFATVYSAIWKDGLLNYDNKDKKFKRQPNKKVALKCLHNSQNITNEFLNEVKEYSMNTDDVILKIYGISQNPDTKNYIMVLDYAEGGDFNNWMKKNYEEFDWENKLDALLKIISGLKVIHQKERVHRDFHPGNVLLRNTTSSYVFFHGLYISDMGLCREVYNINGTKIYGVMPYVAPEVLRGKTYTYAADIYSFGMIMYFVATGKQPFANRAHDEALTISICDGIRPEINEPEAPECYIDLMKRCLDSDSNKRPNAIEVLNRIVTFCYSYIKGFTHDEKIILEPDNKIELQFKKAEEYRIANPQSIENIQSITHPQAIYISRVLNPYTKDLPKYDNINNNSVELTDFLKLSINNENN